MALTKTKDFTWFELNPHPWVKRLNLIQSTLIKHGIKNSYKTGHFEVSEVQEMIEKIKKRFQSIRISGPISSYLPSQLTELTHEVQIIGSVDVMHKDHLNRWWARNLLTESIMRLIAVLSINPQRSADALVIGSDSLARSVIVGLTRIGLNKIYVLDQNIENVEKLNASYNKFFLGSKIMFTSVEQLAHMHGTCGIAVNTIDDESLLTNVYYLNFLQKDGVVIDLSSFNKNQQEQKTSQRLLEEVHKFGARAVGGIYLDSFFDVIWFENIFNIKLNPIEYHKNLFT